MPMRLWSMVVIQSRHSLPHQPKWVTAPASTSPPSTTTAKVVEGYPPIMPSFRGQVTEDQLLQLIAYIKSLKDPKDVTIAPRAAPEQPN